MATSKTPRIILHPGRDASLRRQHPWLFSGAIAKIEGAASPGDLVSVHTADAELLGYGHYTTGSIAVKMLSFGDTSFSELDYVRQSLQQAWARRRGLGLLGNSETNGFRLVHAEGDALPGLVVDVFASTYVLQFQSRGMLRLREAIVASLKDICGDALACIYQKSFELSEEKKEIPGEYLFGQPGERRFLENGLSFNVDWEHGQKTGFFLDQRDSRALLKKYAKGRSLLNCFSYTGGFSVAALAGGATAVLSVDSSVSALRLCEENVALNFPKAQHHCVEADCLQYLHNIEPKYDLIVLDPPAFIKHRGAFKGGLKGYETINHLAMKQALPHTLLFTFSCSQLLSRDDFQDLLARSAMRAGRSARVLHYLRQAPCHPVSLQHPESEYLKGFVLEIL